MENTRLTTVNSVGGGYGGSSPASLYGPLPRFFTALVLTGALFLMTKLLLDRGEAVRVRRQADADGKRIFDYVVCGGGASGCYAAALLR